MAKKKNKFSFKLPKLRKKSKTKVRTRVIREVRTKPVAQVLAQRRKRTAERIAARRK